MTEKELNEIKERWSTRAWPSIGYFVHGQAYGDIQKLLEHIEKGMKENG